MQTAQDNCDGMLANYLLDIAILLTAAVVAVPLLRTAGLGVDSGYSLQEFLWHRPVWR